MYKIICKKCGKEFENKYCNKQFCSNKCFREHNREYMKKYRKTYDRTNEHQNEINNGIRAFRDILQRCNNPKDRSFPAYGGRGIKVEITKEDFIAFYFSVNICSICGKKLSDENRRTDANARTTDRIDGSQNYKRNNLRIVCRSCNSSIRKYKNNKLYSITKEIIEIIKNEFLFGDSEKGIKPLARKYGIPAYAIKQIINNKFRLDIHERMVNK